MKRLAIIPARGGSKRIPGKNIKNFLGKPIIAYSIEAAIKSDLFDEVMVSTDDSEIAEVARLFGAKVPFFRSEVNSNDLATTIDVLKEVENKYKNTGQKFDAICCIYATAPLIKTSKLKEGLTKLIKEDLDSVFPIVPFSFPIWRSLKLEEGKVKINWPEYSQTRSQDLPTTYHDAGQWYWFKPSRITTSLLTNNSGYIMLEESEVQDIDNAQDWLMTEMKYEKLQGLK